MQALAAPPLHGQRRISITVVGKAGVEPASQSQALGFSAVASTKGATFRSQACYDSYKNLSPK